MAPSKLRKAIGAVKDQTSIGLAKVGPNCLTDLNVAIVKSTRHEENPPNERYIREVINLTTYKRAYVNSCVTIIAKRLNKTKNWVVALKSLMLIHRLFTEGDLAFEQEIFFASRRGTRLLNMTDFRDTSGRSHAWDYSAFVRTYALYLDEQLEFRMQGRRGKKSAYNHPREVEEEEERCLGGATSNAMVLRATPVRELKDGVLFSRVHHLMQLLERFLACRPTGVAKHNRVVAVALYPVLKESFQLCNDITEIMGVLIDRFMQLEVPNMVKVHEIFCRVSKQYDELDRFYAWCQSIGIARSSEYPEVEKISQKKLDTMGEYIHEKAVMLHKKRALRDEPKAPEFIQEAKEDEEGLNSIKALPPPERFVNENVTKDEEKPTEKEQKTQQVGDLLNLGDDYTPNTEEEEEGYKLALALFEGAPTTTSRVSPWEAFKDSSGDWETVLVQSASQLSNQKVSLPAGFDLLNLDGMYNQDVTASSDFMGNGSASSVAFGLDASFLVNNTDPFAASLGVAPPSYVQMSELEKKQRLLVQEQLIWQQYSTRDRMMMQGHAQFANAQQQNPYQYNSIGGFTPTYY